MVITNKMKTHKMLYMFDTKKEQLKWAMPIIRNSITAKNRNISKWFLRLDDAFGSLQNADILKKDIVFSEQKIVPSYKKFKKYMKDYVIEISTFHDMWFHFIQAVIGIENEKILKWEKLENELVHKLNDQHVIKLLNDMYAIMQDKILPRNKILHDRDYNMIKNYLGQELSFLCSLLDLRDEFINKIALPILYHNLTLINELIKEIKNNEKKCVETLETISYDLFDKLNKYIISD